MVNYKYQDGAMVNPMQMNPEILSQMMSAQGAGQGVDFNGEPTPNVSGEPSFADMYQEIKQRYDTLIMPLERKLSALQNKLKDNPTDSTIRNEIERIEAKIDKLEQQEDMELQQLEAEVQRTGEQIEAEKQMEGVPVEEDAEPEMAEAEMPVMQKGGVIGKHQSNPSLWDRFKQGVRRIGIYLDNTFGHSFRNINEGDIPFREIPANLSEKWSSGNAEMEEYFPAFSTLFSFNPIKLGIDATNNIYTGIKEGDKGKVAFNAAMLGLGPASKGLAFVPRLGVAVKTAEKAHLNNAELNALLKEHGKNAVKAIGNFSKNYILKPLGVPVNIALRAGYNTIADYARIYHNLMAKGAQSAPRVAYFEKPFSWKWLDDGLFKDTFTGYNWFEQGRNVLGNAIGAAALPSAVLTGKRMFFDTAKANEVINDKNRQEALDAHVPVEYQSGGKIGKNQDANHWIQEMLDNYGKNHPTGIKGYLKDTPWTEYGLYGNMLANLFDNSGRMNIEAQHQFRHNSNPYTQVYDRANREYYDQISILNHKKALDEAQLKKNKEMSQYGSLAQKDAFRILQQMNNNDMRLKNESNYMSMLQNINSVYGTNADKAFRDIQEQNYKNQLLDENERKSYLSAVDKYRKEKTDHTRQLVNAIALAGKQRKYTDMFNSEYVPNYLKAALYGVDKDLMKFFFAGNPLYANYLKETTNG